MITHFHCSIHCSNPMLRTLKKFKIFEENHLKHQFFMSTHQKYIPSSQLYNIYNEHIMQEIL